MIDTLLSPSSDSGFVTKSPIDDYWYTARTPASSAGVTVTEETAMQYATVFACVAKIAKTIATLPVHIYRRLPRDAKEKVPDHPLAPLLNTKPNDEMDAVSFWDSRMANTLLWGTGYAEIQYTNGRRLANLWPIPSREVMPKRSDGGSIYYEWRPDGTATPEVIPFDRMLRLPGLSLNGIIGLSVIGYHRESIGLGMAATEFGSRFFKNGASLRGVIQSDHAQKMSEPAYNRLKAAFSGEYAGLENAHGTPIIEDGYKYTQIGVPPEDAQFLDTRKFQRTEICGLYDVPPHKIGDLERSTFSNIEEQNIQWVVDCIGPWVRRIEAALNMQLLGNDPTLFVKFNLDGLLRGDIERRYEAYSKGRQWGWHSINDIRRMEDMNPIDNGDDYLEPLNMRRVGDPIEPPASQRVLPQPPDDDEEEDEEEENSEAKILAGSQAVPSSVFRPLLRDAWSRIVTREVKAITNAYRRTAKGGSDEGFRKWLEKFGVEHEAFIAEVLLPAVQGFAAADGRAEGYADVFCDDHAAVWARASIAAVMEAMHNGAAYVPSELSRWEASKAEEMTEVTLRLLEEK